MWSYCSVRGWPGHTWVPPYLVYWNGNYQRLTSNVSFTVIPQRSVVLHVHPVQSSCQPLSSLCATTADLCSAISLLTQHERTKSPAQTTCDGFNLSPVIWTASKWTTILTAETMKNTLQASSTVKDWENTILFFTPFKLLDWLVSHSFWCLFSFKHVALSLSNQQ